MTLVLAIGIVAGIPTLLGLRAMGKWRGGWCEVRRCDPQRDCAHPRRNRPLVSACLATDAIRRDRRDRVSVLWVFRRPVQDAAVPSSSDHGDVGTRVLFVVAVAAHPHRVRDQHGDGNAARIEFSFPYIGVLTVHSGIVTIALGSIYYAAHKQEGDMLLSSGPVSDEGVPSPGEPETGFYDNTHAQCCGCLSPEERTPIPLQGRGWDQRLLTGIPRYHEYYNVNVLGLKSLPPIMTAALAGDQGKLDINLEADSSPSAAVDPDIQFRVVGYAPYAELITSLVRARHRCVAARWNEARACPNRRSLPATTSRCFCERF